MKQNIRIITVATGPPTDDQKRQARRDSATFGQFLLETITKRRADNDSENHGIQRSGLQKGKIG